jgi:hypothetical protein
MPLLDGLGRRVGLATILVNTSRALSLLVSHPASPPRHFPIAPPADAPRPPATAPCVSFAADVSVSDDGGRRGASGWWDEDETRRWHHDRDDVREEDGGDVGDEERGASTTSHTCRSTAQPILDNVLQEMLHDLTTDLFLNG